eukprot:scaffold2893_cov254-Pinguiococcus_pyrenoidosus.AAC.34
MQGQAGGLQMCNLSQQSLAALASSTQLIWRAPRYTARHLARVLKDSKYSTISKPLKITWLQAKSPICLVDRPSKGSVGAGGSQTLAYIPRGQCSACATREVA